MDRLWYSDVGRLHEFLAVDVWGCLVNVLSFNGSGCVRVVLRHQCIRVQLQAEEEAEMVLLLRSAAVVHFMS